MHNIPDFLRITPEMQEHFAKGGMIKRADGSYSRRGLWDNIRANRGSGRKPTKEMLEQEAKIRAEEQYGGLVEEFGKGGYTVRRSNDRKGKTHVVIGPDGTKKYFGDSKLGQHPRDPERKKAFYARHKHNLANNPYFRAFARATWETGGEVPEYQDGTSAVDLTEVRISPRQYKELSNEELRALHNKVGRPESSDKKDRLPKIIRDSIRNDVRSIKRLKNAITNSAGTTDVILGPSTQYEGNNGQYYALTPREAEQFNQYESNLPWYKNLWYNVATRDIPQGSRLANYEQRQGAYMNNFPYVYTDTNGEATQLNTPVMYRGKTYTTPFIVNPEEEGSVYYSDGTVAPSYRPNTNNSTQVNPQWIAQMQQQGYKTGGYYSGFFSQTEANRIKRSRTPNPDSMTPSFFPGGFTEEKDNPFENMDLFGSQSQGYPGASSIQNSNLNSANKLNTKMTPLQEKWAHEEMGKNLEKTQSSPFAKEARVFKDKLRDPNSDLNKIKERSLKEGLPY
jgi:predicted DNA binding CopG/RHH family protein